MTYIFEFVLKYNTPSLNACPIHAKKKTIGIHCNFYYQSKTAFDTNRSHMSHIKCYVEAVEFTLSLKCEITIKVSVR